jgi:hypothetical protein
MWLLDDALRPILKYFPCYALYLGLKRQRKLAARFLLKHFGDLNREKFAIDSKQP